MAGPTLITTNRNASLESLDLGDPGSTEMPKLARWWADPTKRLNVLIGALLLALAFAFMWNGLPPARVAAPMDRVLGYLPWNLGFPDSTPAGDLLRQQLPWRHWMRQEFSSGRFPLWASAPLGGTPLFASMQPGVLYPLHLLWILMPVGAGLGIIMALKFWLTGLGMWVFLRTLEIHPAAALISSLGLMFSTWVVAWSTWQHTSAYLLTPWLMWIIYSWWQTPKGWKLALLAVLVGCGVFSGHPETFFMMMIVAAMWSAALALTTPWRQWPLRAGGLVLAVTLGFAIGAVQLLPFLQALSLSHIHIVRLVVPTLWPRVHIAPEVNVSWLLPRFFTYYPDSVLTANYSWHEANAYVGLVALLGLFLVLPAGARRELDFKLALPWAIIGAFAWIIAYEGRTVGMAVRSLPIFNETANTRWIAFLAFAVLVVSAFGWDWLARTAIARSHHKDGAKAAEAAALRVPPASRWHFERASSDTSRIRKLVEVGWERAGPWQGVALVLLAQGAVLILIHTLGWLPPPTLAGTVTTWRPPSDSYRFFWAVWQLAIALSALGAAALWATGGRARRLAPALLVALVILDLWRLLVPTVETTTADRYYPRDNFLDLARQLVPPPERVLVEGDVMPTDTSMIYQIRDWRSQDPMLTERAYQAAIMLSPGTAKDILSQYNFVLVHVHPEIGSMLGMRYLVFRSGADPNFRNNPDPDQPQFTSLADTNGLGLWRIEGVPGFAYLSDNVEVVPDEKAAAEWMRNVTWKQVRAYAAIVEAPATEVASVVLDPSGTSPGGVTVQEYAPGYIRLEANATRTALLVVAESFYPGWRATIDGQPVGVLRANYLSQGVVVPAGTHTIELHYRPGAFIYGALISGFGILGAALLVIVPRWRSRRQKPTDVPQTENQSGATTREAKSWRQQAMPNQRG